MRDASPITLVSMPGLADFCRNPKIQAGEQFSRNLRRKSQSIPPLSQRSEVTELHSQEHHQAWPAQPPLALSQRPHTLWGKVKQFFWGFFFFDYYHELQHERARYADIMNVILYGELLGIPLMNSTMGLRLLPYTFPELKGWLHRQAEEKEVLEEAPHIH